MEKWIGLGLFAVANVLYDQALSERLLLIMALSSAGVLLVKHFVR